MMKFNGKLPLKCAIITMALLIVISGCDLGPGKGPDETGRYRITFNSRGGSAVSPISAYADEPIEKPEDPEYAGYRFDGWFLDDMLFEFSIMPGRNITLNAVWTKYYTITFNSAGGSDVLPMNACAGDDIYPPASPRLQGSQFMGWLLDDEPFTFTTMPENDLSLVASWSLEGIRIIFNTGVEGFTIDPITAAPGAMIAAPPDPVDEGRYFVGWYAGSGSNRRLFRFTVMPQETTTVTAQWVEATNLPALNITLHNRATNVLIDLNSVNREVYTNATIGIAGENGFEPVPGELRGRGYGSWGEWGTVHKKPYRIRFETRQEVLGMPSSRHWVIIAGIWNEVDRAQAKPDSAFRMARELFTNIEYATRTHLVDVNVNGEYRGVYTLSEHVRVANERVNIESEHVTLDTGYLLSYTWNGHLGNTPSHGRFQVNNINLGPSSGENIGREKWFTIQSPDYDDYNTPGISTPAQYQAQLEFIKAEVEKLTAALGSRNITNIEEVMDIPSFIDSYILHELYKQDDCGSGGFFLYKKAGGKFFAGPPWDWDRSFNGGSTGLHIANGNGKACPFFTWLYNTTAVQPLVRARWRELSPGIKNFVNDYFSDEKISTYRYSISRNFARWGWSQGGNQNGQSQSSAETQWANEMRNYKSWLINRANWLDGQWNN